MTDARLVEYLQKAVIVAAIGAGGWALERIVNSQDLQREQLGGIQLELVGVKKDVEYLKEKE